MISVQEALLLIEASSIKPWRSHKIRILGSQLSSRDLAVVLEALERHEGIRSLEVGLCSLDEDALLDFSRNLKRVNLTLLQLVQLDLGDRAAHALAAAVQECSLKKLDLTFNEIGDPGAYSLANALSDCGLEVLLLGRNKVTDKGAKAFAKALTKGNSSLKVLDLRRNAITDEGAIALIEALPYTRIQTLQLDANNLTGRIIPHLCASLPKSCLEALFLGSNLLTDDAVKDLARAINCSLLKKLCLNANIIGDEGCIAIAESLRGSSQLDYLDLRQNAKLGIPGASSLMRSIHGHRSIQHILLSETGVCNGFISELNRRIETLHCERAQIMTLLLSHGIVRLGYKSPLRALPPELFRCLASMF